MAMSNTDQNPVFKTPKGLSERTVREISAEKGEPDWMLEKRLSAYKLFLKLPMPSFGPDLSQLNFDNLTYYIKSSEKKARSWEDVPQYIKDTFDKLGIPQAERKFLAGVEAQFESEAVYQGLKKEWAEKGIIFTDSDTAVKEYPEIIKKHFGTIVPASDNKFAALNTAVWSGGTFLFIPKNVKIDIPVQAYFRINAQAFGQFERTLIICEEGSKIHYMEGCTAPIYSEASLHAAVVECIAKPNSHLRYTTIQNWSTNIYNLVTKRAFAYENAFVEWVDGNMGSLVNMKYPAVHLKGKGAKADFLSIAYAGENQYQDAGARAIHEAENTTSIINSKNIAKNGGTTSFRGTVRFSENAKNAKSSVKCDALLLDSDSRNLTTPLLISNEFNSNIFHEAKVGKISDEHLFYLMNRGLSESEVTSLIVLGFVDEFMKELPLEYAVEFNRLVQLEVDKKMG
ncbi:Fe-S cluster assembly protein SufB [Candidatus Micrarchaeota archaeon]|nr:Fe-S cluster assembly protein SufB [Candidatus Micrarchaeota archaeon]